MMARGGVHVGKPGCLRYCYMTKEATIGKVAISDVKILISKVLLRSLSGAPMWYRAQFNPIVLPIM